MLESWKQLAQLVQPMALFRFRFFPALLLEVAEGFLTPTFQPISIITTLVKSIQNQREYRT